MGYLTMSSKEARRPGTVPRSALAALWICALALITEFAGGMLSR